MQTVKPASNQLFCKPSEAEKVTKSGFLLSDDAAERPKTAEVINVGSNISEYKKHDTVVYKPYAISEIKLNGDNFFLISEDDVLGTVVEVD